MPENDFPERSFSKTYFPENLFSRIYTCQNEHLAKITFPRKLIFQVIYTLNRKFVINRIYQRWSRGHKARGQGHKKIRGQGQGQPFRGQTLSRPRTGMLEAKAKDQGHKAQVLSKKKKKGLHKNFSSDLH